MRDRVGFFVLLFVLFAWASSDSRSQVVPRVAGLERDSVYMGLLAEEARLQRVQDSLQGVISENRKRFAADADNRELYERNIMELEGKLFEVRNRLGIITTDMNGIEQEFILRNMNEPRAERPESAGTEAAPADLLQAPFLRANLTEEERRLMRSAAGIDARVKAMADRYGAAWQRLRLQRDAYLAAEDQAGADSVREAALPDRLRLQSLQDSLESLWRPVFEHKLDNYRVLLDKLNASSSLLEPLAEKGRVFRNEEARAAERFQSPAFAMYSRQKLLLLEYEKVLAKELGLRNASDSLARAASEVEPTQYEYPFVDFPEREFLDYAEVKVWGSGAHSAKNPVPAHETPRIATVYKLLVGTYPKAPALSVFKGVNPLTVEELEDGSLAYYAGAYPDREEAQKGLERLRKLGMKPEIVGWSAGKRLAEEESPSAQTGEKVYKVEFPELSDLTRELIGIYAEDKELSKIERPDGTPVFSLGVFEKRADAENVADKIGNGAKVVEIQL